MESPEFTEEIDLQKYWLVLRRRWLPATGVFGIVVGLATLAAFLQKPIYEAEGKLLFKPDRSSSLTGLKNDIGELASIGDKSNPLSTEAEIIQSLPILENTINALALRDEEGKPLEPKSIMRTKRLKVNPVTGTDVLQLTYKDTDPKVAAAAVNKIMELYIENDINTNREKAATARKFINNQLPRVEETVTKADAELRKFKEKNRVVVLQEESTEAVKAISELDKQIAQLQAQLANLSAQSESFRNQMGLNREEAVAVTSLSQSPGVQAVLTELQKVQTELAAERRRFLDTAPPVVTLKRKEAELSNLLQERVDQVLGSQQNVAVKNLQIGELKQSLTGEFVQSEVQRSGLSNQLNDLYKTRAAYKNRSDILPQLAQTQRELERRVEASQTTYETLLNKLQEARVAENQTVGNARVISMAQVPDKKAGPSKKKYLAAGILGGTLLGLVTAFLLDLIDKSVKTVKEAKELFGYTLLGVIPTFGKSRKTRHSVGNLEGIVSRIVARDMQRSPIAQAYQMLQANLRFLSSDKQLKAIVVTSSVPKEGKSEVSANLAASMAQVGRRVLLVDADMRHPSQHHLWELTNSMGLSNILVGEAEFNTAVKNVMPGLDLLTSGVIPPNPVALLDSKRMASLMETFSKNYDFVIVDTPPLAGIADAPILGKMADGILLVVRPGIVDSASAKAAKDFLGRSGQNVLGLVTNGVMTEREPDSYFYYTKEDYTMPDSASQEQANLDTHRAVERS
ncbi:polysaccharide biosynthesis tyrosine autokinase [Microcoleus sp. FACHB-SPT15]|uniref:GumC family protein n=1 Tax=Microcoleus sp. FACHB-SPT15 TaxID=2692830 RepID=UPI001785AD13|nr:polysaccharide biosynthesis tyrosine autokinase [Microcoleus sp. FACHB-SPT15]MBD1805105.1 polysaccharide biosynthesis tyrosine autokinase [Microcoleus sp. FACHB-SPT15]